MDLEQNRENGPMFDTDFRNSGFKPLVFFSVLSGVIAKKWYPEVKDFINNALLPN